MSRNARTLCRWAVDVVRTAASITTLRRHLSAGRRQLIRSSVPHEAVPEHVWSLAVAVVGLPGGAGAVARPLALAELGDGGAGGHRDAEEELAGDPELAGDNASPPAARSQRPRPTTWRRAAPESAPVLGNVGSPASAPAAARSERRRRDALDPHGRRPSRVRRAAADARRAAARRARARGGGGIPGSGRSGTRAAGRRRRAIVCASPPPPPPRPAASPPPPPPSPQPTGPPPPSRARRAAGTRRVQFRARAVRLPAAHRGRGVREAGGAEVRVAVGSRAADRAVPGARARERGLARLPGDVRVPLRLPPPQPAARVRLELRQRVGHPDPAAQPRVDQERSRPSSGGGASRTRRARRSSTAGATAGGCGRRTRRARRSLKEFPDRCADDHLLKLNQDLAARLKRDGEKSVREGLCSGRGI